MERFVEPTLNYADVRTLEDFQRWAEIALDHSYVQDATIRDIALALFRRLSAKGQYLVVSEINKAQISEQIRQLMTDSCDGLYSVLGFHLPREGTGALVAFRSPDER